MDIRCYLDYSYYNGDYNLYIPLESSSGGRPRDASGYRLFSAHPIFPFFGPRSLVSCPRLRDHPRRDLVPAFV